MGKKNTTREAEATIPKNIENLIFEPERALKAKQPLKFNDVKQIVEYALPHLKQLPNIIDTASISPAFTSVLIVGDTRGEIHSTIQIVQNFLEKRCEALIFLGDYVDDGLNSVINLFYLLSLMVAWPKRIVLLRGNHEDLDYNAMYGFSEAVTQLFPKQKEADAVLTYIRQVYDNLPLVAISPQNSFCVHGGIPRGVYTLEDLQAIPKPHSSIKAIRDPKRHQQVKSYFDELRWNDPIENELEEPNEKSYHRYYFFNESHLREFLDNVHFKRLIRSHESQRGSFQRMFNGKLLHILSYKSEMSASVSMGYYVGQTKTGYLINERNDGSTLLVDLGMNVIAKLPD